MQASFTIDAAEGLGNYVNKCSIKLELLDA